MSLTTASAQSALTEDTEATRRRLRVRLLRDLVTNGLYRVPTQELVERLVPVLAR